MASNPADLIADVMWRNRYRLARLDPHAFRNVATEVARAIAPPPLPEETP